MKGQEIVLMNVVKITVGPIVHWGQANWSRRITFHLPFGDWRDIVATGDNGEVLHVLDECGHRMIGEACRG